MTTIPANYRALVYNVATVALAALFVFGVISPEKASEALTAAALAVGAAASLLARFNLTPDK